jgi:hypothetical protein
MARVDRRSFLRTGGQGFVALAGVFGRAPASWRAETEIGRIVDNTK